MIKNHADVLLTVLKKNALGRSYNIGGENEVRNIDLAEMICTALDGPTGPKLRDRPKSGTFVTGLR